MDAEPLCRLPRFNDPVMRAVAVPAFKMDVHPVPDKILNAIEALRTHRSEGQGKLPIGSQRAIKGVVDVLRKLPPTVFPQAVVRQR